MTWTRRWKVRLKLVYRREGGRRALGREGNPSKMRGQLGLVLDKLPLSGVSGDGRWSRWIHDACKDQSRIEGSRLVEGIPDTTESMWGERIWVRGSEWYKGSKHKPLYSVS